jgi:roadblock/LC7 domain-containing protein
LYKSAGIHKGNNKITELRAILQIRVITKLPNSEQSVSLSSSLCSAVSLSWDISFTQFSSTCFDNYFTYFVPVFKYCYSDSLWTVMRAGDSDHFSEIDETENRAGNTDTL